MDDNVLIEVVEGIRRGVGEWISDLDALLARATVVDYRTATPWELQAVLAQVVTGLDPRGGAAELRKIQRWINRAEAIAPDSAGKNGRERPGNPWIIEDNPGNEAPEPPPPDEHMARGIRYLGLPAFYARVVPLITHGSPMDGSPEHAMAEGGAITVRTATGEGTNPMRPIPTRFGQELADCSGVEDALALAKKRLPRLKPLLACSFLSLIGYPVAPPWGDVLRLCGHLGMLTVDDSPEDGEIRGRAGRQVVADAAVLTAFLQRAGRLTCMPAAQVGHLLAVYCGAVKVADYRPGCSRNKPACDICHVRRHCARADQAAASDSKPVTPEQNGSAPLKRQSIKDWAIDERPRERLLAGERLSNAELVGIILRTGNGSLSAVEVGRRLINEFQTLHNLDKASPAEIISRMKGTGIGPAKAAEICAAIELGRRIAQPAADNRLGLRRITSSRDIFELFRARFKAATQEEFYLVLLNTKHHVQKEIRISLGTLNSSIVHPRDVFGNALREGAFAVIFVHNHPSGDPSPSEQDLVLTARLVDAGKLLGVSVLDHVVIGSHEWYSFADHGRIN